MTRAKDKIDFDQTLCVHNEKKKIKTSPGSTSG